MAALASLPARSNPSNLRESEGRRLLIDFIETFLGGITVEGFQAGYGCVEDQILFRGPAISTDEPLTHNRATTLSVPTSILLQPHHVALAIIENKIKQAKWAVGVA